MVEVVGDSARGADFALVSLTVEGDRIVAADAPGLARKLGLEGVKPVHWSYAQPG